MRDSFRATTARKGSAVRHDTLPKFPITVESLQSNPQNPTAASPVCQEVEASVLNHAIAVRRRKRKGSRAPKVLRWRRHAATKASILEQIANFAVELQSCTSSDEALKLASGFLRGPFPVAGVLYACSPNKTLEVAASWGGDGHQHRPIGLADCLAMRHVRLKVNQVEEDASPRCAHFVRQTGNVQACFPLAGAGEVFGAAVLTTPRLTAALQRHAEAATQLLGVALAALKRYEAAMEDSLRDPLTGLSNKRCFDRAVDRELARAVRERKKHFAVCLLDVDGLKPYNDTNGHPATNAFLVELANLLRHRVRGADVAARWGGDELSILLVGADGQAALVLAEQIRGEVKVLPQVPGQSSVSVSIGIAVYPDHGETAPDLMSAADKALYRAKQTRDCAVIAEPVNQFVSKVG